jgi:hypothetical protein
MFEQMAKDSREYFIVVLSHRVDPIVLGKLLDKGKFPDVASFGEAGAYIANVLERMKLEIDQDEKRG